MNVWPIVVWRFKRLSLQRIECLSVCDVSVGECVCVWEWERGLYSGPAVEMMLNEQIYCALCHLSTSSSVSPQIDQRGDICHHWDKVECEMRGISNLHNKQWNSNYQPLQTIFPALTFGLQDCSIIHCHCLTGKKKERGVGIKKAGRRQWRVWCIDAGLKTVLGQIWLM